MSTLTPLRGPARVAVRQHRRALQIAGLVAVAGIIVLVVFALRTSHVMDTFAAGPCEASGVSGPECDQRIRDFSDAMYLYSRVLTYASLILTVLPGVVSAFVAGPVIARELESGTYRMAWTQSVTPTRWLAAKLAVPAVLLVAGVSLLSAVFTWARPRAGVESPLYWYEAPVFAATPPAVIGCTLLGIAVGALTGLLVRRTVAAMSVAALVMGTVITTLASLRSSLWPLRTVIRPTEGNSGIPNTSWVIDLGRVTGSGERLPWEVCLPRADETFMKRCLTEHDVTGAYLDYHPASHFWPLQLVETGILLAFAALALALAFRVLRRRHG
ncbi:hypothetical protein ABZS61_26385 [Streptomyces sp. NPDC005566]|uniref:hypothetical protein n=1 Tax=Streptomyces sp. NPDC005566 TaxID=3156886 RepID=UPI0033A2A791